MPGWLGLPPIQQPSCPLVYDWFGWSGHVQEGHSFRWWHLTVLSKAVRQPASRLPSVHCCWIFFHYIVILHGTMVDILESMILFCLLVQPVLSKQIHPHLIFHVWTGILQHPWKIWTKNIYSTVGELLKSWVHVCLIQTCFIGHRKGDPLIS